MTEIRATRTLDPEFAVPDTLRTVRAQALFMSTLQPSESPSPDQVRRGVETTLRRLGITGCSARVADEFGGHPDTAPARMRWALTTIDTVYPAQSVLPAPHMQPLALAS
jgi:hypothetical protein